MDVIDDYTLIISKTFSGQSAPVEDSISLSGGTSSGSNLINMLLDVTKMSASYNVNECSYDMQTFKPGHISVDMTLKYSSPEEGATVTEQQVPSYQKVQNQLQGAKATLSYGTVKVATGYFVYSVDVSSTSSDLSIDLHLEIYSLDKLLDLQPMTAAYTAQTISDIAQSHIDQVNGKIGGLSKDGDTTFSTMSITAENNLNLLKLQYTEENKPKELELKHPYLVQYNETIYSFLSRVLARTGEFMYWDGANLSLGLKEAEKITETTGWYKSLRYVSDNSKFGVFNVESWHRNSQLTDNSRSADINYVQTSPTGNDEFNTPLEVVEKVGSMVADLPNILFEGFLNTIDESGLKRFLFMVLRSLTAAGTKTDIIKAFLLNSAWIYPFDQYQRTRFEKIRSYNHNMVPFNSEYDASKNYNIDNESGKQKNDTHLSAFGYLKDCLSGLNCKNVKVDELSELFYRKVAQAEVDAANKEVIVDMDNSSTEVHLGTVITLPNGKDYIVVSISGKCWRENNKANFGRILHAIPKATIKITDKEDILWLPKPLDNMTAKASGPLIGYVVETNDPYDQGRVRVRMSWQKSDDNVNATPWIRSAMPMAGEKGNVFMQHGVGDEVLVDFEEGNMERPYVRGALYNADHKVIRTPVKAYTNGPTSLLRTITTGSGSGLFMQDESFKPSDAFNLISPVAGSLVNLKQKEWNDEKKIPMGANISLSDFYGFYNISMSSVGRKVEISSPLGTVSMNAFTGITISAPNGDINILGKNVNITAGNKLTLTSGTNIPNGRQKNIAGYVTDLVVTIIRKAAENLLGPKLVDLSLVRSVMEIFVRPLNGTLLTKSNRYLLLEAGKGKAEIPYDSINMSASSRAINNVNSSYPYYLLGQLIQNTANTLNKHEKAAIDAYNKLVDFIDAKTREQNATYDSEEGYKGSAVVYGMQKLSPGKCKEVFDNVVLVNDKYVFKKKSVSETAWCPVPNKHPKAKEWLSNAYELGTLLCNYQNAIHYKLTTLKDIEDIISLLKSKRISDMFVDAMSPLGIGSAFEMLRFYLKDSTNSDGAVIKLKDGDNNEIPVVTADNIVNRINKAVDVHTKSSILTNKRFQYYLVKSLVDAHLISFVKDDDLQSDGTYSKNSQLPLNDADSLSINDWNDILGHLVPYFFDDKKAGIVETVSNNIKDWADAFLDIADINALLSMKGEREMWNAANNPGGILMSDQKGGSTISFNADGGLRKQKNASVAALIEIIQTNFRQQE